MNQKRNIALSFDIENEYYEDDSWLPDSVQALLELLSRHESRATFFVVGYVVDQFPEVVKDIAAAGHEVACHGTKDHTDLHLMTGGVFRRELRELKEKIYGLTGSQPIGFRAPRFSLDQRTGWILPILEELGFSYDSSIFPIHMGTYGVYGAPKHLYRISSGNIIEQATSNLIEVPVSVYEAGGRRLPLGGGIYFRLLPLSVFKGLLRSIEKESIPVLYFHPHDFFVGQAPIAVQGKGGVLNMVRGIGLSRSLKKLESLLSQRKSISISELVDAYAK